MPLTQEQILLPKQNMEQLARLEQAGLVVWNHLIERNPSARSMIPTIVNRFSQSNSSRSGSSVVEEVHFSGPPASGKSSAIIGMIYDIASYGTDVDIAVHDMITSYKVADNILDWRLGFLPEKGGDISSRSRDDNYYYFAATIDAKIRQLYLMAYAADKKMYVKEVNYNSENFDPDWNIFGRPRGGLGMLQYNSFNRVPTSVVVVNAEEETRRERVKNRDEIKKSPVDGIKQKQLNQGILDPTQDTSEIRNRYSFYSPKTSWAQTADLGRVVATLLREGVNLPSDLYIMSGLQLNGILNLFKLEPQAVNQVVEKLTFPRLRQGLDVFRDDSGMRFFELWSNPPIEVEDTEEPILRADPELFLPKFNILEKLKRQAWKAEQKKHKTVKEYSLIQGLKELKVNYIPN